MQNSAARPPRRSWDPELSCALVIGPALWILVALKQGYDFDWDVLNYHFYNGFALLHGKVFSNVQPSMMQAYFPPLMDTAFYILVRLLPPSGVLMTIAAFQGLAFPLLFALSRCVLRACLPRGIALSALAWLLALLGAAAPINIWEAGGALGDTASAVPVLAALLLMIDALAGDGGLPGPRRFALIGLLAGLAAGLKLTNLAYALAFLSCLMLVAPRPADMWRQPGWLIGTGACLAGMAAGFMLCYGWWGIVLYLHVGNPVFPNFNQLFRSPFGAVSSYSDAAFALPGIVTKLVFPFLRTSISGRLDPAGLFDLRMAFMLPLGCAGLLASCFGSARRRKGQDAGLALMLFALVSYVAWLLVFPVNRYLVGVDMIAPLACVSAAHAIWHARRAAWAAACVLAVALPASASMAWPLFWLPGDHRHGDENGYFGVSFSPPPGLSGGVVAMLGGWPTTFVIPFFPRDTVFVRLQGSLYYAYPAFNALGAASTPAERRAVFGNATGDAVCQRLAANRSGLFLLRPGEETGQDIAAMSYFGLEPDGRACTPIASKYNRNITLCPARRLSHPECSNRPS
jgi:hypothetical protein